MTGEIQNVIENVIADLTPRVVMEAFIRRKLALANIDAGKKIVKKIADHIQANDGSQLEFSKKYSGISEIDFTPTEDDESFIEDEYRKVIHKSVSAIGVKTLEKAASTLIKGLDRNWPDQHKWEIATTRRFRDNLERRWEKGFSKLRMMVTISLEIANERVANRNASGIDANPHTHQVLRRLHIRGCQVIAEILALMECGFADGAIARWRTLYEIETVMTLIATHDDEMAERYLAYEVVEAKNAADLYAKCHESLGFQAIPAEEILRIDAAYDSALAKYGPEFGNQYGWAAKSLKRARPTIFGLLEAAGKPEMKSYYKLASYNVHAGVKGITTKLGSLGPSTDLAGASNAGFEEPGQLTACSIARITALLFADSPSIDETFYSLILNQLRDQAIVALMKAAAKLKRDDEKMIAKLANNKTKK